jgi:hypothetical protein
MDNSKMQSTIGIKTMATLIKSLLLLAALAIGISPPSSTMVQAQEGQYDSRITLSFVINVGGSYKPFAVPDGNPQAVASCYNTDSIDMVYSYDTPLKAGDTSATVYVTGATPYNCELGNIAGYGSAPIALNVGLNQQLSADAVLVPFDASADVHLVDALGKDVQATGDTYLYCGSSELAFSFPLAMIHSGESDAIIALAGGHSYVCGILGMPGYVATESAKLFLSSGDSAKRADLPVSALTEHIVVALSKSDADYVVSGGEFVYASCQSSTGLFFGQQIMSGSNNVDILAVHGDYTCWASIFGYAVGNASVSVAQNQTAYVNLPVIDRTAGVHIYLQDQNNNAVTTIPDLQASVWPDSAGVVDSSWGALSNDSGTFSLAPNVAYRAVVYSSSGGCGVAVPDSGQQNYLFACSSYRFQAAAGQVAQQPITVYKSDATINVTVLDSAGAPKSGAWVQAVESQLNGGSQPLTISSAITNSQGAAAIPVVSSKVYVVSVSSSERGAGLAPSSVQLSLSPGETKAVTLNYEAVDFQLNITAQIAGIDHGTFYCYAYDDTGHLSASELGAAIGQTLMLPLNSASTWHLGCSGANESVYFSTDEITYLPPQGQPSDTITISQVTSSVISSLDLRPEAGSLSFHIDGQSFNSSVAVTSASSSSLRLSNGTLISMPAGAFDSAATVTAANATGLTANAEYAPVTGAAVNLSAHDGANSSVGISSGKSFTITFALTNVQLGGIDSAQIRGALFNTNSGKYTPLSVSAGSENTFTLTASQLGSYVLLVPRAPAVSPTPAPTPSATPVPINLPDKPSSLKVAIKRGRLTINWRAPSGGGAVTSYGVSLARGKRTVINASVTKLSYTYSRRPALGRYTLKLTAANESGQGKAAQKKFRIVGSAKQPRIA